MFIDLKSDFLGCTNYLMCRVTRHLGTNTHHELSCKTSQFLRFNYLRSQIESCLNHFLFCLLLSMLKHFKFTCGFRNRYGNKRKDLERVCLDELIQLCVRLKCTTLFYTF